MWLMKLQAFHYNRNNLLQLLSDAMVASHALEESVSVSEDFMAELAQMKN